MIEMNLESFKECENNTYDSTVYYRVEIDKVLIIQENRAKFTELIVLKKELLINVYHGITDEGDYSYNNGNLTIILENQKEEMVISELNESQAEELLIIITNFMTSIKVNI